MHVLAIPNGQMLVGAFSGLMEAFDGFTYKMGAFALYFKLFLYLFPAARGHGRPSISRTVCACQAPKEGSPPNMLRIGLFGDRLVVVWALGLLYHFNGGSGHERLPVELSMLSWY